MTSKVIVTFKQTVEHLPFFVYGTLLPGHDNYRRFFDKIKPVREENATLISHALIGTRNSHFPYLAQSWDLPDHININRQGMPVVRGVLLYFSVEDFQKILPELDYLEGVPDHYNRKVVNVYTIMKPDAPTTRAWTYYAEKWLVDQLLPYPFIPDGDWDKFANRNGPKKVKTK